LEDILLVHRIDLVVLPKADPFLAANIIRGERLFSHDSHAADEYELSILRRAGDFAPLDEGETVPHPSEIRSLPLAIAG